jgi:hypothetical protein
MSTIPSRIVLLAAVILPLAGCLSYTEAPKPAPVVVVPPAAPPSGTVTVQPAQ